MVGKKTKDGGISDDDKQLWEAYARATKPLEKKEKIIDSPPDRASRGALKKQRQEQGVPPRSMPSDVSKSYGPSHLTVKVQDSVDKSYTSKLKKGQISIEASIDLHGMTQREALPRLDDFIRQSHRHGHRFVLVITGKGKNLHRTGHVDDMQVGVLREKVPEWLESPWFAPLIISVTCSLQKHGGSGAYYVHLRRQRASPS